MVFVRVFFGSVYCAGTKRTRTRTTSSEPTSKERHLERWPTLLWLCRLNLVVVVVVVVAVAVVVVAVAVVVAGSSSLQLLPLPPMGLRDLPKDRPLRPLRRNVWR